MPETAFSFSQIESPSPGSSLAAGKHLVRGWVQQIKADGHLVDVRARPATGFFPAFMEIPRTDLASHFNTGRPVALAGISYRGRIFTGIAPGDAKRYSTSKVVGFRFKRLTTSSMPRFHGWISPHPPDRCDGTNLGGPCKRCCGNNAALLKDRRSTSPVKSLPPFLTRAISAIHRRRSMAHLDGTHARRSPGAVFGTTSAVTQVFISLKPSRSSGCWPPSICKPGRP